MQNDIVIVGNDSDILHSGYSHAVSDGGKRYPSVNHYAHSMTLSRLGLDESVLLDLLCVSTRQVASKAHELLVENMPHGHDLNSLADYLTSSRHSYTMQGLRLRVNQDKTFEQCLMETNESLIIVCDSRDKELGIGMEEQPFLEYIAKDRVDAQQIAYWMRNDIGRPAQLGANQLGYFLMWLRHEVREAKKNAMLSARVHVVEGLSRDQNEKHVQMNVNDHVICLTGVFRPLSNYFAMRFEMKGEMYRSVEHYAYEKLLISLKLDDKQIEKITTTVLPISVPIVAQRIFKNLQISDAVVNAKSSKLDRWRQSAMKHKLVNNDFLLQLLLSTGDALLVDTANGDRAWTCSVSEMEVQNLLAKDYVDAPKIVQWMRSPVKDVPKNVRYMNGNKTGLLLMELRTRLAATTPTRIPLVAPLRDLSSIRAQVSHHVICFTPECVWHPLYPAEIFPLPGQPLLPSPAHYIAHAAIKMMGLNKPDAEFIVETKSSLECWQRLHQVLQSRSSDFEKENQWWMVQRQALMREALLLLLEQHPPLLRALLDTHDALLVYCARHSSTEAELSIGMRECDLRAWMHRVDIDSKQLMDLCVRPMAFRPPFLGGNQLGLLLMELRREFVLRGVFPHTLPDLNIGGDAILGTDSPTENMMVDVPFDILDEENYTAVPINPLLLLAKEKKDANLNALSRKRKTPPRFMTMDEEKVNVIVDDLEGMAGKVDESYLHECSAEDLRAVFLRLCTRIRVKWMECEAQQMEMNHIAREVSHMQYLRRCVEDGRIVNRGDNVHTGGHANGASVGGMSHGPHSLPPPSHPPMGMGGMENPLPPQSLLNLPLRRDNSAAKEERSPRRAVGGHDREGLRVHPDMNRAMHGNGRSRRISERKQVRGDLLPPSAGGARRGVNGAMSPQRRRSSKSPPPVKKHRHNTPPPTDNAGAFWEDVKSPAKGQQQPPPPKIKAPRPAVEELSDGEILDSDED